MGKRYIDQEKLFSNFTIEEWKIWKYIE
jgi:hypothetical protein